MPAKTDNASPPRTAPTALRSAVRVPSLFCIKVRLAGKMAGKAKNAPPNRAPTALPSTPAPTDIAAPNANRTANSVPVILRTLAASMPGHPGRRLPGTDEHRPVEAEGDRGPTGPGNG